MSLMPWLYMLKQFRGHLKQYMKLRHLGLKLEPPAQDMMLDTMTIISYISKTFQILGFIHRVKGNICYIMNCATPGILVCNTGIVGFSKGIRPDQLLMYERKLRDCSRQNKTQYQMECQIGESWVKR
jgi:hypothetical protein